MFTEINYASDFICRYLYKLDKDKLVIFKNQLIQLLSQKYHSHWNLSNPIKGSAYRSITIMDGRIDSIILIAAQKAGINVFVSFPSDLVIWCDPYNVSYRVGGDYNRIYSIYDESNATVPTTSALSTATYQIPNPKKSYVEIKPDTGRHHKHNPHSHTLSKSRSNLSASSSVSSGSLGSLNSVATVTTTDKVVVNTNATHDDGSDSATDSDATATNTNTNSSHNGSSEELSKAIMVN